MNDRLEVVIDELRAMFKDGATPSRLIRHIAERHAGQPGLHTLIQDYFLEAFAVPLVRGLDPTADYHDADLRLAYLNEDLIHEMVRQRDEWDVKGMNGAGSWLDAASVGADRPLAQVDFQFIPELRQCWPQLSAKERAFIQRSLTSANNLYESVKILAGLAERLQQQVNALQASASREAHQV